MSVESPQNVRGNLQAIPDIDVQEELPPLPDSPISSSSTIESGTATQTDSLQLNVAFVPLAPQAFNRYGRGRFTQKVVTEYTLPPLTRRFSRPSLGEWIPHQHPEGALYFIYIKNNINVFTDADLYNPALLARLTSCMDQLLHRSQADIDLEPSMSNVDLVLEILNDNPIHLECGYYFADHDKRIVFWLDKFNMTQLRIWKVVPGITTGTHAKLGLEIEYWKHCDLFPSALSASLELIKELRDMIVFSIADIMTSPTTTISVSADHLERMLSVVNTLETDIGEADAVRKARGPNASIDRATGAVIAREKFYNFNGEYFARLDKRNSVYGTSYVPTQAFLLGSLLLFNAPVTHLTNLEMMFKDEIISVASWNKFIGKLRSEWQETVLFATLILNANVGQPAQISSYISVYFGLGSIITGLMHSRQYNQGPQEAGTGGDLNQFFAKRRVIGMESLAILYSWPYAFMIWGMITFFIAFLMLVLQSLNGKIRIFVILVSLAILISTLSCVIPERMMWFLKKHGLTIRKCIRRLRDVFWF
ncbi:hypothetical protein FB451DRAFT_1257315 [Mycena latifolia]|nr:hypothetical protein FB451DRAFT_1257315 [Mycena latifolia]